MWRFAMTSVRRRARARRARVQGGAAPDGERSDRTGRAPAAGRHPTHSPHLHHNQHHFITSTSLATMLRRAAADAAIALASRRAGGRGGGAVLAGFAQQQQQQQQICGLVTAAVALCAGRYPAGAAGAFSSSWTAAQEQQQQWPSLPASAARLPSPLQPQLCQQQRSLAGWQAHAQKLRPQPAQQLQQQRGMAQLRPYADAPKPLRRFFRPDKGGRLNRMAIRVPPLVQVALQDGKLVLTGKAGSTALDLALLDPTGLVAWQCHSGGPGGASSLLLLVSPSTRYWRSIQTQIDNAVHGVMQGYLVGLTVQGVGYRLEPVADDVVAAALLARRGEGAAAAAAGGDGDGGAGGGRRPRMFWEQEASKSNITYPHKQPARAVRLKVGFTKAAIFPLPAGVLAFFLKPTLMYLYGVDKQTVTNAAAALRAVRKPNPYTGNGVQLVGKTLKLRQRAGSK